jgi:hypothetical protein
MAGAWEFDYFVGVFGFAFIVFFGMVRTWLNEKPYRSLFFAMIVLALFSFGDLYKPLFNSPLPFLDSERAPARFIIVPVVFLIVLASIQFSSFVARWNREHSMEKILVLFGSFLVGYELFQHSRSWRLVNLTTQVLERYNDIIQVKVVNISDPVYTISIISGLAVTVVSLAVLAFLARQEHIRHLEQAREPFQEI